MSKISALLLIMLMPALLLAQFRPNAQAGSLAFIHVTLIDLTNANPKQNMTVIVTDNRIFAVGRTGKVRVPKDAQTIDASGKFLIPGLWDMHAHSIGETGTREIFFPLELANGITGVRDMFADCYPDCSLDKDGLQVSLPQVNEWRRADAAGTLLAPRFIASSPRSSSDPKEALRAR